MGTIIGYDDWWVLPCGQGNEGLAPLGVGEGRAHAEAAAAWGATLRCVGGPCADWGGGPGGACDRWTLESGWGALFEVTALAGPPAAAAAAAGTVGAGGAAEAGGRPQAPPEQHGFTMGAEAERRFREHNALCRSIRADGQVCGGCGERTEGERGL